MDNQYMFQSYHVIISYVVSLCLSEELEQVSPRHELHDDIHRIIV